MRASARAARVTGRRFRRCSRAANSGTTPPYSACIWICDETTLERIRPCWMTAVLVSSQDVSNARSTRNDCDRPDGLRRVRIQNSKIEIRNNPMSNPKVPPLFGSFNCDSLLALRGAFGEKHNTFEEVHCAVQLRITGMSNALTIFFF